MSEVRQDSLHYLRVLNRFATDIIGLADEVELARYLTREVVSQLDFNDCVIYFLQGKVLKQVAALGVKSLDGEEIADPIAIPLGKGIVGSVAQSGQAVIIDDVSKDPRYICDMEQGASEICVPIMVDSEVVGVIDCEDGQTGFFQQSHLDILTTLAGFAASKVQTLRVGRKVARQSLMIREIREAILVLDESGLILDCNRAASRIFGRNRPEMLASSIQSHLANPENWDALTILQPADASQAKPVNEAMEVKRRDGRPAIIDFSVSRLPGGGQNGNPAWFVLGRDITGEVVSRQILERRGLELAQSAKEATMAQERQAAFLAKASHEIRTPLNAIVGFSEMLRQIIDVKASPEKAEEYIGLIHQAGGHLSELIEDMLSLSSLDAGQGTPRKARMNLGNQLNQCVRFLENQASQQSVTVNVALEGEVEAIEFDRQHFRQIMINLIDNAIKYSARDSQVHIETVRLGDSLDIHVRDEGIGIDSEGIKSVFEPFTRDEGALEREIRGVGLGLSLAPSPCCRKWHSPHRRERDRQGVDFHALSARYRNSIGCRERPEGSRQPPSCRPHLLSSPGSRLPPAAFL